MNDRDEIIDELGDKLCEGRYCDSALDGYFDSNNNQENIN